MSFNCDRIQLKYNEIYSQLEKKNQFIPLQSKNAHIRLQFDKFRVLYEKRFYLKQTSLRRESSLPVRLLGTHEQVATCKREIEAKLLTK